MMKKYDLIIKTDFTWQLLYFPNYSMYQCEYNPSSSMKNKGTCKVESKKKMFAVCWFYMPICLQCFPSFSDEVHATPYTCCKVVSISERELDQIFLYLNLSTFALEMYHQSIIYDILWKQTGMFSSRGILMLTAEVQKSH